MSKIVQDETLNLMSQVSKKSLELYQLFEKGKGNISAEVMQQIRKQDKMKILKNLQAYVPYQQPPNQNITNTFSSGK